MSKKTLFVRAEIKYVDPAGAKKLVVEEGYTVLDIRDRVQYEKAHIVPSVHIPVYIENTDNDIGMYDDCCKHLISYHPLTFPFFMSFMIANKLDKNIMQMFPSFFNFFCMSNNMGLNIDVSIFFNLLCFLCIANNMNNKESVSILLESPAHNMDNNIGVSILLIYGFQITWGFLYVKL